MHSVVILDNRRLLIVLQKWANLLRCVIRPTRGVFDANSASERSRSPEHEAFFQREVKISAKYFGQRRPDDVNDEDSAELMDALSRGESEPRPEVLPAELVGTSRHIQNHYVNKWYLYFL